MANSSTQATGEAMSNAVGGVIPFGSDLGTVASATATLLGESNLVYALPVVCPRSERRVVRTHLRSASRKSLYARRLAAGEALVVAGGNRSWAYRIAKRAIDIIGAAALLVLLSPIMLTILVVLTITTKGRPLFIQRRAGYLGRPFPMIKFRTMRPDAEQIKHTVVNEADGPVFKNRRDPRITRLGRWLRKTSLDETPQLINVLLGQMSLVGPRPLVFSEVERFAPWQRERLCVMPGLTCLWQVSGRSDVDFANWMRMDIWYVRHQSLWTDFVLLLNTPASVISGRGAY